LGLILWNFQQNRPNWRPSKYIIQPIIFCFATNFTNPRNLTLDWLSWWLHTLQSCIFTDFVPQTWTFSVRKPVLKNLFSLKNLAFSLPAGFFNQT
jgi:hypothetical protein